MITNNFDFVVVRSIKDSNGDLCTNGDTVKITEVRHYNELKNTIKSYTGKITDMRFGLQVKDQKDVLVAFTLQTEAGPKTFQAVDITKMDKQ